MYFFGGNGNELFLSGEKTREIEVALFAVKCAKSREKFSNCSSKFYTSTSWGLFRSYLFFTKYIFKNLTSQGQNCL